MWFACVVCIVRTEANTSVTMSVMCSSDKPLSPSDLTGVSLGSNSALVSWSRPLHDGNSPVVGYILEHKRVDQVQLSLTDCQRLLLFDVGLMGSISR